MTQLLRCLPRTGFFSSPVMSIIFPLCYNEYYVMSMMYGRNESIELTPSEGSAGTSTWSHHPSFVLAAFLACPAPAGGRTNLCAISLVLHLPRHSAVPLSATLDLECFLTAVYSCCGLHKVNISVSPSIRIY